tara:strand:- start:281 stop:916 length:636 start_codon:yes stop_codon:yes gene_type:complete
MAAARIWIWVGLTVLLLGGASLRMFMQAQYYKGVADVAAETAKKQSELITEIRSRTQALATELEELTVEAEERAREDSIQLAELNEERNHAASLSDSLAVELSARLDSLQQHQLENLIASHRVEVIALEQTISIESAGRINEALRADRATNLVLQLEQQVDQMESRDVSRIAEIEALREVTSSLGFSFDTSWLTGAGGVVLGYTLASLLNN